MLALFAASICSVFLWRHYVIGLDYTEIAEELNLNYDIVRMKIRRCLNEAKSLWFPESWPNFHRKINWRCRG